MSIDTKTFKTDEFEAVASEYIDAIYSFVLHILGDEYHTQILVEGIYIRAYKYFNNFEDGISYKSWLFKISTNALMNFVSNNNISASKSYISDEDDLFQAMHSLPVQYRIIIMLADVERFSYKEISYLIGYPIEKIASILYESHKILKEKMKSCPTIHDYSNNRVYKQEELNCEQ